jgi:FixJ family two-component response regulator
MQQKQEADTGPCMEFPTGARVLTAETQDQPVAKSTKHQHLIAVVENDPSVRKALARLLRALGYRVELFVSATEFMSAAAASDAACLLVDFDLGSASGLDLARWLAASGFKFPLVFMTGSHDDDVYTLCTKFGCAAFLKKPFNDDVLLRALKKAIGASERDWRTRQDSNL